MTHRSVLITQSYFGGPGWIRTSEGVSQQIYSLPRLSTSVPTHILLPEAAAGALYATVAGLSNLKRMAMCFLDSLIASRLQWPLERGELELLLVKRAQTASFCRVARRLV